MPRRKTKDEVTEDVTVDEKVIEEIPIVEETPVKKTVVKPKNHDVLLPRSASRYVPLLRPLR